jgi:N-acetylglucosaminyl-diphospho-decaprenol L-rhamnosyltransferase
VSRAPVLVVVVSYNTAPLLNDCLTALKADADAGRVAVCVVDNASTDESVALVRERHPWAALIASQENLGFGRAVNAAVREHGTHAWVAPANADTTVEPGAIAALLQAGAADPGAGVLAPRLILPDGSTQHSVHSFPTLRFTLAFQARMGDRRPAWGDEHCLPGRWNAERERRVPWAVGAFLLVREEAWQAIGGFDEALWMYAEDVDLGWRAAQAGWGTRYVPAARVHHNESAATNAAWGDDGKADRWNRATYSWMHRRLGGTRTRAVAATNVVGHCVRALLAARRGDREEAALHRKWVRRYALGLRSRRALSGENGRSRRVGSRA